MKESKQDHLLNELLGAQELESLRRATLEAGLASLKRKRQRVQVARICGALLLPLIGLGFLCWLYWPVSVQQNTAPKPMANVAQPAPKVISERELFALFPNRPMALVGKPGHQQVVFLDEPQVEEN